MKFAKGFALFQGFSALFIAFDHSAALATTDIKWVQNELATQQLTTIEAFLAALPQEYHTNFTLMYDSNSLQQATPLEPRVISVGDAGSLVIAYNGGDTALRGSDTIELIQFNQPETKFEFYEISKAAATGRLQLTQETDKCEACHRSGDPRPNWQPYDNWPGAYGSLDDQLTSDEQKNYASFLKVAASNPRYATLNMSQANTDAAPNDNVVNKLSQWNYMRAARLVQASRDYAAYKYAILGTANCSDQFASFFPKSNPLPSNWNTMSSDTDPWVAAFIYLFSSRQIAWQDWTMLIDGVQSTYFDNNPFIAGYTYGQDLVANLVKQDAELQVYAAESEDTGYDSVTSRSVSVQDCDALAKQSAISIESVSR